VAAAFHQQDEEVHGLPPEFDGPPVPAQLIRGDVELEVAEAEPVARS
jgi:hypothetical protein